jgi:OOP family OmpA-OmpF porin
MRPHFRKALVAAVALFGPTLAHADSWEGPPMVFFDWESSVLPPPAIELLQDKLKRLLLPRIAAREISSVGVAGATDRSGDDQYNMGLSFRRAQTVRDFLIARGVPANLITIQAYGENRLLAETADGVREPQNRHVVVTRQLTKEALSGGN